MATELGGGGGGGACCTACNASPSAARWEAGSLLRPGLAAAVQHTGSGCLGDAADAFFLAGGFFLAAFAALARDVASICCCCW